MFNILWLSGVKGNVEQYSTFHTVYSSVAYYCSFPIITQPVTVGADATVYCLAFVYILSGTETSDYLTNILYSI